MKLYYYIIMSATIMIAGCANTKTGTSNSQMPEMQFTQLNGNSYNSRQGNYPVVIFYFDPNCSHCKRNTEIFKQQAHEMDNMRILLVSPHSPELVGQFNREFELDQYPQLIVLLDQRDEIKRIFRPGGYPTLYLYDENREFVRSFQGVTQTGDIQSAFASR